jgi:hypothetical protein
MRPFQSRFDSAKSLFLRQTLSPESFFRLIIREDLFLWELPVILDDEEEQEDYGDFQTGIEYFEELESTYPAKTAPTNP